MARKNFVRIYVWELPVRIFHWLNALCVVVLATTGFIIADPPAVMSNNEATGAYWFGTVRAIHFIAAYLFFVVMVLRVYWAFVGNRYAHWTAFIPWGKKAIHNVMHVIKHDILLLPNKNPKPSDVSIGHNKMATLTYLVWFVLGVVMVFTGFTLLSDTSEWWLPGMFAWVSAALGGDFNVRMVHHVVMWLIILIMIIHIYLVLFHDWLDARGETSSMLTGYKFVWKKRMKQD